MRYDFCVGRLIQLEDCKKYGVKVTTTSSLEKYLDLTFREEAVNEIVQRTQEKIPGQNRKFEIAQSKAELGNKISSGI